MTLERRLRQCFRGRNHLDARPIFPAQTVAFTRAHLLIRCYYAALLYFAVTLLTEWPGWLERGTPNPLWPLAWLGHVNFRIGIGIILTLFLVGALAGAMLPGRRWARLFAFVGFFQFAALNNSYGKIGHSLHAWVLTAALFIFLPDVGERVECVTRLARQKFLSVFWFAQAMILLLYSMAGIGKVAGAIYQMFLGQTNAFMPGALAATVAGRLLETNSRSLLGPWLIEHPLAGWPLMLADIYLQLFSFWIAFRPAAQRMWAFGLIAFHIGSYFLLTVNFPQNVLLLALLFLNSPFRREPVSWRRALADLPVIGSVFERLIPCAS